MLNLLPDNRISGRPKFVATTKARRLMRVPDDMKKCAVFVAIRDERGQYRFKGTAFFYLIVSPDQGENHPYLITARHVIEGAGHHGSKVHLRVNLREGGGHRFIETDASDWWTHPTDETVDVAVLPLDGTDFLDHGVELFYVISLMGVNEQLIRMEGVGVGDDTFVIGLFTQHAGRSRNIPIVRVGSIAAMPEEKVESRNVDIDAYLVEVRSLGGLSGSPVFLNMGPFRPTYYERMTGEAKFQDKITFLGLIHGHWNTAGHERDQVETDASGGDTINQGIAMVVPADKITEVLNQPALEERREAIRRLRRQANGATEDSK